MKKQRNTPFACGSGVSQGRSLLLHSKKALSKDENYLLSTWDRGYGAIKHSIYKAFTFITFKPHHKLVREVGVGEMQYITLKFVESEPWTRCSAGIMHTK